MGGHLTDRLTAAGHDVLVYDMLLYEDVYLKPVQFVYGDILDRERLLPYLQGFDVVVWLAALVGDGACALDEDLTVRINVDSVRWLCSASAAASFSPQPVRCTEPKTAGSTRRARSTLYPFMPGPSLRLKTFSPSTAYAVIFRLGTLYGLGDRFSRLRVDLVVNTLTVRATLSRRMSVFGGEQYRPLLHVRDVAEAVLLALGRGATGTFRPYR